jgi:hypothetical protein
MAEPTKHTDKPAPGTKAPVTKEPQRDLQRVEHTEDVKMPAVREGADAARDRLAASQAVRTQQIQDAQERDKWRPTPTQEENDLIAMGLPVDEVRHADSGAPPDKYATRNMRPNVPEDRRDLQPAEHRSGYETR